MAQRRTTRTRTSVVLRKALLPMSLALASVPMASMAQFAVLSALGMMALPATVHAQSEPACDPADVGGNDGDGDEVCSPQTNQKSQGNPKAPGQMCMAPGASTGDPIDNATGNLYNQEVDWEGSGPFALTMVRSYNSFFAITAAQSGNGLGAYVSPMGVDWTFSYAAAILPDSAQPLSSVKTLRPDGRVLTYTLANGVWSSDADINARLTAQTSSTGAIMGWTLTTDDDATETYDASGRLQSITNRAGLTQTLSYSTGSTPAAVAPVPGLLVAVTDGFGRQLQFTYNAQRRIQTATDPDGGINAYAYDGNGNLVAVTHPDGRVRKYLYQSGINTAFLTGIVDESGTLYASYNYDPSYANITQTSMAGGVNAQTMNFGGSTTTATDALGATRTYNFQSILNRFRNTSIQTPCVACANPVNTQGITYNPNGYVASFTDTPGDSSTPQNTAFQWDTSRNLMLSRSDAVGSPVARTVGTTWDAHYRLPTTVTLPGLTTTYAYDSHGNVLSKTQADTVNHLTRTWQASYTYAANVPGAIEKMVVQGPRTDLVQLTTTDFYAPDATCPGAAALGCRGHVRDVVNALGQTTTVDSYNAVGKPLQITDPDGLVIQLRYDAMNRLIAAQVGSETTQYAYDAIGNLTQVTRPDGSTVGYSYDAAHRLTGMALADGSRMVYTLDKTGDITQEQIVDASGTVTYTHRRSYDALGRLAKDIGAYNQTSTVAADAHDNPTAQQGPRTDISNVTQYQYDPLNRLIQLTQADGGVDKVTYDPLDHITQVTDPNHQATQYVPDAWGDALTTVSADTGATTRVFDGAGNVVRATDAKGQVITSSYDALNRLIERRSAVQGTPTYRFVYDQCDHGVGHLCAVRERDQVSMTFAYDGQERLARRTDHIRGLHLRTAFTYQPGGQLASLTYPDGQTVQYQYDTLGRISQVTAQAAHDGPVTVLASHFTYHPFAGPASFTYGNGAAYVQDLDLDYRPSVEQSGPWAKGASYDQAGNLSSLLDVDNTEQTFRYDAMNHLTQGADSAVGGFGTRAYTYDLNGNRTSVTRNGTTAASLYNPPNWLVTDGNGGGNRQRDADGNTVFTPTQGTFLYDGYQRLIGIKSTSSDRDEDNDEGDGWGRHGVRYRYNAFGERTAKVVGGQTTRFVYGPGGELLAEADQGGHAQDYVWLYGKPLARLDGRLDLDRGDGDDRGDHRNRGDEGDHRDRDHDQAVATVYYFHTDALGTPQAMTDAHDQVVWQAHYSPFGGAQIAVQAITNNLRFLGQYHDQETGLSYNLHRTYDPSVGRYVEADPMGLAAGTNVYAYVGSNPLTSVDPLGLYDVIVAVWRAEYLNGSVGHVATFSSDGSVLTSQFPDPHGYTGANTTLDWQATISRENRQPDDVYKVHLPDQDEAMVEGQALAQRTRSTWDWFPTNKQQTNCTTAAIDVLGSIGIQAYPNFDYPPFTPHDVNSALNDLSNQTGSNVTRLSNVPW